MAAARRSRRHRIGHLGPRHAISPLAGTDFGSARFRFARDSPLEGGGFELLVPRHEARAFPGIPRIAHRIGSCSASPEALEFRLDKFDRLLNRFALLCADGNHFADRALGSHLRSDTRRRGISREEGRHIVTWRIIIKRSRGGLFLGPLMANSVRRCRRRGADMSVDDAKTELAAGWHGSRSLPVA
jgi:hypothetical protein